VQNDARQMQNDAREVEVCLWQPRMARSKKSLAAGPSNPRHPWLEDPQMRKMRKRRIGRKNAVSA